jgi:hypothetical protein
MKNIHMILMTLILLVVFSIELDAQIPQERKYDPNKIVKQALINAVTSKYGAGYKVSYHIMDSLIAHSRSRKILDPYRQLNGCVLFSAWRNSQEEEDSIVTGIYKGGQIIWNDYPGTKAGFGGRLLTTQDINNDGEVDILQAESDFDLMTREGSGISYLWILSWNGTRGKMINNIDPATHQSTIVSMDEDYELIDANRDGVLVIRGTIDSIWQEYFPNHQSTTLPKITYGWNGTEFGFWPTVRQIPESEFLPANNLEVTAQCKVSKSGNNYVYDYSWTNKSISKQGAQDIYVGGLDDTSSNYAPSGWDASSSSYIGGRFFCNAFVDYDHTIRPGQTLAGFGTVSTVYPKIVRYYVQGLRTSAPTASDEEYRNDILTNSATGYTLGTSDTTQPFVPLTFLDTLASYTTQSHSLGWIKDQTTADKYLSYFSSARARIVQRDSVGARAVLEQVLHDIDSTTNLTSEAYALLKYNTEYLVDKLRQR